MAAIDSGIGERRDANRASLESLTALMQSGAVCTPQFPVAPSQASCHPPMPRTVHWSHSPGGSSTAVVTTPSTTSAERGGMQPALLRDQTVDIFLDETLVAIDARSTWTCTPVA
jgi:hypothetical protein